QKTATAFHPLTAGTSVVSLTQPTGFSTPTDLQQLTVTVTAPTISMSSFSVGKDLEDSMSISLSNGPPSAETLTLTSSDPSVLLSTSSTVLGSQSLTFNLTAGQSSISGIWVQALAASGAVQLKATATGYSDGTGTITLAPSGFSFNTSTLSTTTFAANSNITLIAWRL